MNLLFLRYTIRINQFIFIYLKSILLDKYTTERPKSQHFPVKDLVLFLLIKGNKSRTTNAGFVENLKLQSCFKV
jgi:hypothetical protein